MNKLKKIANKIINKTEELNKHSEYGYVHPAIRMYLANELINAIDSKHHDAVAGYAYSVANAIDKNMFDHYMRRLISLSKHYTN